MVVLAWEYIFDDGPLKYYILGQSQTVIPFFFFEFSESSVYVTERKLGWACVLFTRVSLHEGKVTQAIAQTI